MDLTSLVVTCVALLIACVAQRVAGMGFGLVMAPTVAIVAGPTAAVLVVNLYAALACGLMVPRVWRDIDWRRLAWLAAPAIVLTVPGLLIMRAADADVMRVVVGIAAIVGVVISVAFHRTPHTLDGAPTRLLSGGAIGLLNASVGLGAPPVGVYAIISRWDSRPFTATMQPFWLIVSGFAIAARSVVAPAGAPAWPWWGWLVAAAAAVVGTLTAERLAGRLSPDVIRIAIVVLSLASGLLVTVMGVMGLVGS